MFMSAPRAQSTTAAAGRLVSSGIEARSGRDSRLRRSRWRVDEPEPSRRATGRRVPRSPSRPATLPASTPICHDRGSELALQVQRQERHDQPGADRDHRLRDRGACAGVPRSGNARSGLHVAPRRRGADGRRSSCIGQISSDEPTQQHARHRDGRLIRSDLSERDRQHERRHASQKTAEHGERQPARRDPAVYRCVRSTGVLFSVMNDAGAVCITPSPTPFRAPNASSGGRAGHRRLAEPGDPVADRGEQHEPPVAEHRATSGGGEKADSRGRQRQRAFDVPDDGLRQPLVFT